jgi:hypothetical protein
MREDTNPHLEGKRLKVVVKQTEYGLGRLCEYWLNTVQERRVLLYVRPVMSNSINNVQCKLPI